MKNRGRPMLVNGKGMKDEMRLKDVGVINNPHHTETRA